MPILKIKQLPPPSLARVCGIIGIGLGIAFSVAFWMWIVFVSLMVGVDVVDSIGGFFAFLFFVPIAGGILGTVSGFLIAKIYNFIAFSDRGLDIEVEIEPDHQDTDEPAPIDE